jgi:acyl-CoA thioesterase FadM
MVYRVSKNADGTIVATAKTGLLFFDYTEKKVASIPDEFKPLLAS